MGPRRPPMDCPDGRHRRAVDRSSNERPAFLARAHLRCGGAGWDRRTVSPAHSAAADRRILAGALSLACTTRPSLDRRRPCRRGGPPRCRTLDHESSRCDRRASVPITDAFFGVGRHRHVGRLRSRHPGCIPTATGFETEDMAHIPLDPRCVHRSRDCDPCPPDRRNDGTNVEGCPVRIGGGSDFETHG